MTTATITRLGARGDGVAEAEGKLLHIPYALPGEVVEIEPLSERIRAILTRSPERITPFCPHFGTCGGCKMQHLAAAPYAAWKRGLLEEVLARAGLTTTIAPLIDARGTGRRRVTLHVRFEKGRPLAGFMAAKTHDLIDLDRCPVLTPGLERAADITRAVVMPLARLNKTADVQVTTSLAGLDVDIRGPGKLDQELRLSLTEVARQLDLARLSLHGDIIVERRAPELRMGRAVVVPPPGGFLQATEAGEAVLADLTTAALGKAKKVADLFCGVGPFTLRIAEGRAVDGFDSDAPAIAALTRAARATPGLKPLKGEARDLFRRPLLAHELKPYDAVVLDPPRAGAEAQIRQIALAKAPARIVYVSCEPQSFARDARLLVDAGYRLEQVTPVDQFAHTAHLELVGVFGR